MTSSWYFFSLTLSQAVFIWSWILVQKLKIGPSTYEYPDLLMILKVQEITELKKETAFLFIY